MANKHQDLVEELQEIGLSEKEAQVYISTLELGQETVQNIAQHAGVNRATTYVVLESLQRKGIVTTFDQGKKTVFIAEGPSALHNIIREQQAELQSKEITLETMMPQLMSVYNLHPDKPKVTFYDGKEGLKAIQRDFLDSEASEGIDFFSLSDVNRVFTPEEADAVGKERRKKKMKIKAVFTDSSHDFKPGERIKYFEDDLTTSIQLDEKEYPFTSDIAVYGDKVSLASLQGHVSGVILQNKQISQTIKSVFELAFNRASKLKK